MADSTPIPAGLVEKLRDAARAGYADGSDNNIEVDRNARVIRSGNEGFWIRGWLHLRATDLIEDTEEEPG
jgi:hypothetical protein